MKCKSGRCFSDSTVCGMYGFCADTIGKVLPRYTKYVPKEKRAEDG